MRNIKKDFFGNQVLTDINLELEAGQVLGLVGENGAGKSTLMKILFGATDITATGGYGGDILLDGEKVSFSSPFDAIAAGIGVVHQEFSLIPGFEAEENIVLNREPKKKNLLSEIFGERLDTLDRKAMDETAVKAIEKMGVNIDRHMVISSMPVGHKQFTEIARELSKDQLRLLILDEPTAVLTEREAEALLDSIRGMSARGISVIFITHRLQEILSVCDTVAVMRDGVLVEKVPAKQTSVQEITHWMVGRNVDGGKKAAAVQQTVNDNAKTALKIEKLWVDMPGETVRNVSLEVKEGEILGITKKNHIVYAPHFYEKDYFTPGDEGFPVFDTSIGKVAQIVCFDRHFPESFRTCALKGADFVVTGVANEKIEPCEVFRWEILIPAFQNSMNCLMVNRVGVEGNMDFCGESVFAAHDGTVAAIADDSECLLTADLDFDAARKLREEKQYLSLRRPEVFELD